MSTHYTPLFSSIRHSTKLAALPDDACRLFYLLLLAQADAWGRLDARPSVLFAEVWPLMGKGIEETRRCRDELAAVDLIALMCHDSGASPGQAGPTRANAGQAGRTQADTADDGRDRTNPDEPHWIQIPDWEDKAGTVGKRDHRKASRWPQEGTFWPGLAPNGPGWPDVAHAGPRARAHSQPQPQPQPQPEPQKKSARARKTETDQPPSGPHALTRVDSETPSEKGTPVTRHWEATWNRTRPTPWAWKRQDAIQLAQCTKLAEGDEGEVCRRITRLLESPDAFHAKAASPGLLLSQWNNLGFDVREQSKGERAVSDVARQLANFKGNFFGQAP